MTCNKCGNNLPDNAGFCPYCGTQFEPYAAPQGGYSQPVYQPESAGQYYAPPVQEPQTQYEAPVKYEAPTVEASKPAKKKKSVVGIIFTVVAIILVVGLAGLNVVQYLKAEETAEDLTDARDQITTMEEEAGELKEENDSLDAELTQLKGEYDALTAQAADIEETIADYENQISALESENAALTTSIGEYEAQLESSGAALETYAYISEYLSSSYADDYRSYSHFYTGTNLVVVKVGGTVTIDATFTKSGSIYYAWDSNYINMEGLGFNNNVCPIVVTGIKAGVSTIEFTNDVDSSVFEILVIVVE